MRDGGEEMVALWCVGGKEEAVHDSAESGSAGMVLEERGDPWVGQLGRKAGPGQLCNWADAGRKMKKKKRAARTVWAKMWIGLQIWCLNLNQGFGFKSKRFINFQTKFEQKSKWDKIE
jgi:hypothetical protein